MDVPGRPSTAHVAHGGDPPGVGMENPGPYSEGNHQHKRHRPTGDPVEGDGDTDQQSPLCQPTDVRRPPGFKSGRGTGGAIMELKINQELARID